MQKRLKRSLPITYTVRRLGYRNEREMLDDLYVRTGLSIRQVAAQLGRSYTDTKYRLTINGFGLRGRGGPNNRGADAKG